LLFEFAFCGQRHFFRSCCWHNLAVTLHGPNMIYSIYSQSIIIHTVQLDLFSRLPPRKIRVAGQARSRLQ
jgi:hypothetical protein